MILPLHVQLGDTRIEYATAEIAERLPDASRKHAAVDERLSVRLVKRD